MPIYEYLCKRCGKVFSALVMSSREEKQVRCGSCAGKNLKKLVSSFAVHQTEEQRLADFDTSKPRGDDFYKDSRNIGLWAKKRARELGADLGPQFDEVVEKARTGKILEEYEK